MSRRQKRWTGSEKRRLIEEYTAGVPVVRIALALGRTRNSVIGYATRLGLVHGEGDAPEPDREAPPPPARLVEDVNRPRWRCHSAGCRRTRQPGRDHCAECITAARVAAREEAA